MNKIVYMKFGSHLYGTDTPDSDVDFKGVYLPTLKQIYLGKYPSSISSSTGSNKSKNTNADVDDEIFSLQQFIKLACEGQTVAIDMLHAPYPMVLEYTSVWESIVANREKFYTKNLNAFVGYCRRQASKYGIKGSRLNSAKLVREFLWPYTNTEIRMRELWEELPEGEHIHYLPPDLKDKNAQRIYQVCGKKFLETVKPKEVVKSLDSFIDAYGHRAELAAKNQGIDWKAISHAMRSAYQLEQIYTEGTIVFPLKNANYLKSVKLGELDYLTEVAPKLEILMDSVERLSGSSDLPEKVDTEFWDNFIINTIEEFAGNE